MKCAVEQDLMAYERKIDRAERRENAIEKLMEQSMGVGEDYHPCDPINFIEGLEEGRHAFLKVALEHLNAGRFYEGGQLLHAIANDHWASIARQDAEYEVDNPDDEDGQDDDYPDDRDDF